MEKAKITFVNGTTIDAEVNGSCYITAKKPEFPDDLSKITIKIGDETKELVEVEVNEAASVDGRYWFALLELSEAELEAIKTQADIQYIAMMSGVDL